MGFDKEMVEVATGDGEHVMTLEDLTYTARDGEVIVVPKYTVSDGASTPRLFWRALPPFGPYWRPALMHDYLYQSGRFVRSKCDRLFLEAMRSCGVGWFKAHVIYRGVRLGGWVAYGNYRKKEKQNAKTASALGVDVPVVRPGGDGPDPVPPVGN